MWKKRVVRVETDNPIIKIMITEIELLSKRIRILDTVIEEEARRIDISMGCLESARTQRDRAMKRIEQLMVKDAVTYPTFIGLDEVQYA